LVFAGLSKLWVLFTDPFPDIALGITKELLCVLIGFELYLGLWNIAAKTRDVLSFFNSITFGLFGTYATVRWLLGYHSCGYAGVIQVPILYFVILDFSICAYFAFSVVGNFWAIGQRWWKDLSQSSRGRLAASAAVISLLLVFQFPFAARLRGQILGDGPIRSEVAFSDQLQVGRTVTCEVSIFNSSGSKTKVVGAENSCTCIGFPNVDGVEIPPGSSHKLSLTVRPTSPRRIHQRVVLFMDHPEQFRMNIDVVGNALE